MVKKIARIIIIFILIGIMCFSAYQIFSYYSQSETSKSEFNQLKDIIINKSAASDDSSEALRDYSALYQMNNDFVGWIKIDGTTIDYPVMQTPSSPQYYLRRNFEKKYSRHGTPFVAEICDLNLPCDNIIIYGHNMKDKTMFSDLTLYKDQSFLEGHEIITFDTQNSHAQYKIIAVFVTDVGTGSEDEFAYYNFAKAYTENEFTDYVNKCKSIGLYHIEETAVDGDSLLTLSTCEYSNDNSRMVVVAKAIKN